MRGGDTGFVVTRARYTSSHGVAQWWRAARTWPSTSVSFPPDMLVNAFFFPGTREAIFSTPLSLFVSLSVHRSPRPYIRNGFHALRETFVFFLIINRLSFFFVSFFLPNTNPERVSRGTFPF